MKGVTNQAFPRKAYWVTNENSICEVSSFKEIYENNIMPIHIWFRLNALFSNKPIITDIEEIKKRLQSHFWNREKSIDLVQTLKKCENQCYRCHKCDEVFETGHVDSVLNLNSKDNLPNEKA